MSRPVARLPFLLFAFIRVLFFFSAHAIEMVDCLFCDEQAQKLCRFQLFKLQTCWKCNEKLRPSWDAFPIKPTTRTEVIYFFNGVLPRYRTGAPSLWDRLETLQYVVLPPAAVPTAGSSLPGPSLTPSIPVPSVRQPANSHPSQAAFPPAGGPSISNPSSSSSSAGPSFTPYHDATSSSFAIIPTAAPLKRNNQKENTSEATTICQLVNQDSGGTPKKTLENAGVASWLGIPGDPLKLKCSRVLGRMLTDNLK
ncbi:hypothetical protein C8J56DRAFT_1110590 [Mycena floridula]|nr:hypothetical protein C8J56DRAFT_1110590 [Mycena floridula]